MRLNLVILPKFMESQLGFIDPYIFLKEIL